MTATFPALIASAAQWCGITVAQILGRRRFHRFVRARWLVIWNAIHSGYSRAEIARNLNLTWWSVDHACRQMGAAQ